MYSGVNDENNQGAFNDENSLYHYSYSKDREPQPGPVSYTHLTLPTNSRV